MDAPCMIIAVSQSIYDTFELQATPDWPLELGPALLYVHWQELYWNDGLAEELRELIERHGATRVRIAAHGTGCFTDGRTPGIFQERRETEELALREKFGETGADVDVQVWAFHHESYSPLWKGLKAVITAVQDDALDDEQRGELGARLLNAFERVEASALREELTLYRHHIMAAYTALRLDLQIAREAGPGGDGAPSAANLSWRLASSRNTALRQFAECTAYLDKLLPDPPAELEAAQARVKSALDDAPTQVDPRGQQGLTSFEAWFGKLSASLEDLRIALAL
jgi:hypothetical protein